MNTSRAWRRSSFFTACFDSSRPLTFGSLNFYSRLDSWYTTVGATVPTGGVGVTGDITLAVPVGALRPVPPLSTALADGLAGTC
ncbi:hypothetical protein PI125_g19720 [Phytophthora idaei]|nr:hypothetical protein PI125_g19720 [Phytophthora idaei]